MKKEKVWKLNMVLWSITLVVAVVDVVLWLREYLTTGDADWFTIFFFVCAAFGAEMWMIIYRREKKKDAEK